MPKKTVDVGHYISPSLSELLRTAYITTYPQTTASVVINKVLIQQILNSSTKIAGIRFTYGLRDRLNPNSLCILLIPCFSPSNYSQQTTPLIIEKGYLDHLGERHSLLYTTELIANFVQDQTRQNVNITYKSATRGSFFGRNSLSDLLKDEQTTTISFTLGLENQIIHPILQALDSEGQLINDLEMERSQPCPPYCEDDKSIPMCLATEAVMLTSDEQELDQYRQFRDEGLLQHTEGASLYEMYYFISPLITQIVRGKANGEQVLQALYNDKIVPFKELLKAGDHESAIYLLKETLFDLTRTYQTVF